MPFTGDAIRLDNTLDVTARSHRCWDMLLMMATPFQALQAWPAAKGSAELIWLMCGHRVMRVSIPIQLATPCHVGNASSYFGTHAQQHETWLSGSKVLLEVVLIAQGVE